MKKSAIEKRLEASGYNLDRGYAPVSPMYNIIWNQAINAALRSLQSGGCDGHAFERVKELLK
jgi:hypothetical protein